METLIPTDPHDFRQRTLARIAADNSSKLKLFEKVYARKAAMIECIEAQCLDCMGFDAKGIAACGDSRCPLHRFRPYQKSITPES